MEWSEPTEPGWYWLADDGEGLTPCKVVAEGRTGLTAYPGGGLYGYALPMSHEATWGGRRRSSKN